MYLLFQGKIDSIFEKWKGDFIMDQAYSSFAEVYDLFMDNVPYDVWAYNIKEILEKEGIKDGIVLDLGCGTGVLTRKLRSFGYDMIGIDLSEEMLNIASKRTDSESEILYLCQDMREFELYGTVKAVVSICDSMNYLMEKEDFIKVLRLVNNYLDPNGIFIFDMNTIYKYETLLGEVSITENREEGSFIWDNYYDRESAINEYDLTLFIREEGELYRKYEETHYQKAYALKDIKEMIEQAGLEFMTMFDAQTKGQVHAQSERVYFVAREIEKNKSK